MYGLWSTHWRLNPGLALVFGLEKQILPNSKKRLRCEYEEQFETLTLTDSMETDERSKDFYQNNLMAFVL